MLPFKNIFPIELDNNLGCASLGKKVSSAPRSPHSLVTSTVVYHVGMNPLGITQVYFGMF